jgi:hypothetical protein
VNEDIPVWEKIARAKKRVPLSWNLESGVAYTLYVDADGTLQRVTTQPTTVRITNTTWGVE